MHDLDPPMIAIEAQHLPRQADRAIGRDYETAFKKYQELRYLRTARAQLMARVFGEIYHASGVNRELRN
jgi:salicylate hydroxylase